MPFITQGKTNWKFLSIVIVLAVIVGAGTLLYLAVIGGWPELKKPEKVSFEQLSTCNTDSDCILVNHKSCGGMIKISINEKYESLYNSTPKFQDSTGEICKTLGISYDEQKQIVEGQVPSESLCVSNKCVPKYLEDETAKWKTYQFSVESLYEEYSSQGIDESWKQQLRKDIENQMKSLPLQNCEFEIKYPPEWKVSRYAWPLHGYYPVPTGISISNEVDCQFDIDMLSAPQNIGEMIDSLKKEGYLEEKTKVNNYSAIKLNSPEGKKIYYFIEKDGKYCLPMSYSYTNDISKEKCGTISNQIVSTFKFLEEPCFKGNLSGNFAKEITDNSLKEIIIHDIINEFKECDYRFEERICEVKDFEITGGKIDLNNDGVSEYVIYPGTAHLTNNDFNDCLCGTGGCPIRIFGFVQGEWKLIGDLGVGVWAKPLEEQFDASVYFKKDVLTEKILNIKDELLKIPNVKYVKYISSEEALDNFREKHKDDKQILEALDQIGENPFFASLNINLKTKEPQNFEELSSFFEQPNFKNVIEKIDYYKTKILYVRLATLTPMGTGHGEIREYAWSGEKYELIKTTEYGEGTQNPLGPPSEYQELWQGQG